MRKPPCSVNAQFMEHNHTISVPNHVLISEMARVLKRGQSATFRVKGWSMRIWLEDERDLVTIKAVDVADIRLYDLVLAEIEPQHYVLHRIIRIDGDRLTLKGDGNVAQIEHCCKQDVVGRVTHFYRKGRTTPESVESWRWRLYSFVWLRLSPIRRYLLGIYRRTMLRGKP